MLTQLRRDHANMARLLRVLSMKQKKLARGERPDFRLIREVVDYILDYMSEFTSPLESLCSEHIKGLNASTEALASDMADDYKRMYRHLRRLSDDLDMILMDAVMPMDKFSDDLKAYLQEHRNYLSRERHELFPLIIEQLDEADYERLRDALPENAHRYLEKLQQDYPELYHEFKEAPEPA
ncbi:hemerythrin domain-containing protein [Larsenimonas salina]|uniref:hemerythrin domain-containing protein n=1 Tax=Larsenimonas salina TaxID=1295565 RepID=UPI0020749611|nr:hemerythrin domain-containing protein [Larsenimonas salina]MCM5704763.1 hemerythrin domain-containing protein [Larsenimonas salina]